MNNSATLSTFVQIKIVIKLMAPSMHFLKVKVVVQWLFLMNRIDVYAEDASIKLCHNKARSKGGGIFIEDTD